MHKQYKYQIYLICLVLLAYWPFTFFVSSLLHDNIDVALSVKYYASECLSNGFLPLWNPFQLWGFPAHADLQYTNWNIETLIIGSTIGYNYYVLHTLFIFYLIIGSIGIYNLSKHLSKHILASFYISVIYILSGIVIGHTQSLVTILGIVFLPFVFLYFFKWMEKPSLKYSLLFSVFFYLLLTLGYQAFAFMAIPVFVIIFLIRIIDLFKIKDWNNVKSYLLWGIFIVFISSILLLPLLVSQIQSKAFVSRLNGMSVMDVMDNPFPVFGLLSLINPLFTIGHDEWFNTEITMRNIYIGTFPLIALGFVIVKRHKSKLEIILLSFIIIYFLASFGNLLPIRKLLYYSIPGFNLFRFPSLLRVVVELLLLILFSMNIDYLFNKWFKDFKLFKQICISIAFIYFMIAVYLIVDVNFKNIVIDTSSFKNFITSLDIKFVTSLLLFSQVLILIAFIFLKFKNLISFKKTIIFLTIIELSIVVSLYGQYTSFSELSPAQLQSSFDKMPKGFVKPSKDAIKASDYKFSHIPYFWKNTGAFKKKLVVDDPWTSFYFSNYHTLTTCSSDLADSLKTYPFIYFSESLNSLAQSAIQPIDSSKAALRNSFQFENLNANYEFLKFTPQTIRLVAASPKDAILNIQQTYYSGWTCSIDSNPTDIFLNAGLLMSIKVPKGVHIIEFNYSNSTFEISLYASYIVLIISLIVLVFLIFKNRKYKIIFTLMILFFTISFVHSSQVNYNDSEFESKSFLTINGNTHQFNLDNQNEMLNVFALIDTVNSNEYSYSWKNYYHSPEFWYRLGVDDYLNPELYHLKGSCQWNKSTIQNSLSLMSLISENKHDTLILNSESPYTPAIDITLQTINRSDIVGKIRLKTEENATPVIACVVKEKNKSEQVSYFEIRKYVSFKTTHSIPFYFKLPERSNDMESIKLFVMNNSKQNIEIMDIEILNNRLSQQDKH